MILTDVNDKIMKFVNWAIVISMFLLVVLISLQIINRFVMKIPMPWTDEFARYFFVYLTMFGSAKAVREKTHIFVDILEVAIKGTVGKISSFIAEIISLIFYIILLYVSVPWTLKNIGVNTESMAIDIAYFYACVPISALIMIIFAIENLLKRFQPGNPETEKEAV